MPALRWGGGEGAPVPGVAPPQLQHDLERGGDGAPAREHRLPRARLRGAAAPSRQERLSVARQERPENCVYSRLEIGRKDYSGRQFVYCKPFKEFHADGFCLPLPPPYLYWQNTDFEIDLDTCWYCRVVLLSRIRVKGDNGQI